MFQVFQFWETVILWTLQEQLPLVTDDVTDSQLLIGGVIARLHREECPAGPQLSLSERGHQIPLLVLS